MVKRARQKRLGRPRALTESEVDALESLLVKMIKQANREYEVTLDMLRQEAKCRASVKTIQRALHKRNIYWHAMREKPSRDARGVVMEKESREARQSARNTVIL